VTEKNLLSVGPLSISNDLFQTGYPEGHSPCSCVTRCCKGGVYADIKERDRILEHKEAIAAQMDETQNRDVNGWFDPDEVDDDDFPSKRCIGTQVFNDKCVMLDKYGRCAIQLAAVQAGLHRWAWKPMYCILFPIEITDGVVGFDPMLQGEQPCCSTSTAFEVPLFRACKAELEHLLGTEGYQTLERHYEDLKK
jgi:hypothetical protein